jgi:cytochrome P450
MRPVRDSVAPPFADKHQRVDSYAEIVEIMRSADFVQGGAPERRHFLEGTMLLSDGVEHSEQKRLFSKLMSREAMAYYELHLLGKVIDRVIENLKAVRGVDGLVRVDVCELVPLMLSRIAAGVTGVDGVDTPERTERFRQLVMTLSEATTASFTARSVPEVISGGEAALEALVVEYLRPSLDRRIEFARCHKAGEVAETNLPRDMLMALCLAGDLSRPDDDQKIPFVWRQCALFLTASVKTTSHSLPHVFVHLAEWLEEHPEDKEKLTDPEFLHMAAGESLRLHQTSPVRFRRAVKDLTLSTGRKVAAGEMVALFAPPANVETGMFGADARYFDPYRKTPDGLQPWGMTFGVGAHLCLGRNLVTGIRNKGDDKYGTQGTMVSIMKALYALDAELDPGRPLRRTPASYHDTYESVPMILHRL